MYSGASRKFSLVLEIENYLYVLLRFREKTEHLAKQKQRNGPISVGNMVKSN